MKDFFVGAQLVGRRRFLLTVLGCVVSAVVYAVSYGAPLAAERARLARDLAELQSRRLAVERFLSRHTEPADARRELKHRADKLRSFLPTAADTAEYQLYLGQLPGKYRLEMLALKPLNDVKTVGDVPGRRIFLEVRGDYFDLLDFLTELEQRSRLVDIAAWQVKAEADYKVRAAFTLEYFYLPPPR